MIEEIEQKEGMLLFIPEELASENSIRALGKIFHHIAGNWRNPGLLFNTHEGSGWIDVESSIDAPNRGMTETDVISLFVNQKRKGQRLNTYVIGSQASKIFTGHYFDSGTTSSWLMGTRLALIMTSAAGWERRSNSPVSGHFTEKGYTIFEKKDTLDMESIGSVTDAQTVGWRSERFI